MLISSVAALGIAIRETRKAQGLSQEQLAAACGLGRRFIIDLESGKETCKVGKVLVVLQGLGLGIELVP